jgi:N-acetylmuramoyl-L-alanine amidase
VVEETVRQIAATLEPLGWRDLHVEALDPASGVFRPLSAFLAPLSNVGKQIAPDGDGRDVPLPLVGAAGLVGQPAIYAQDQPQGALSGKTIYISAGHGWLWSDTYGWRTQRPPYPRPPYVGPIIEDHNNAEAVDQYLLQYLWNAGAMVWPVRERDMNTTAAIVNDDVPGAGNDYRETGTWSSSSGAGYDLDQPGHSYRYAGVVAGPATATATWTAALPADGRYAVYVWYRPGSNRARDAHYTVHHAGGATVVTVDQTRHGLTWHYIGTFPFRASSGARITLSNESSETGSRVVIADAVRIGGGLFEDLAGIETDADYPPDKPWWEAAAFYYTQRQGLDPAQLPRFNDIIARPIYARWEHAGTGEDAVYVSWHSNGWSGYQTTYFGTTSYIHVYTPTERSAALQATVHTELVNDLRAGWDANWRDQGMRSLDLGELRELWDDEPDDRMPGVLLEIAYHDHPGDANALKDPRFNMLAARAVYQGIVKYFAQQEGQPVRLLPEPPTHLRLVNTGAGMVLVQWAAPVADGVGLAGDPPVGYRVYTSTDGFGWSDGIAVAGTSQVLGQLAQGQLVFVRVTSVNEGGESFPTETLAARVGTQGGVLLVNGFDRLNRFSLVPEIDPVEGYNMRMPLERMNRYDYVIHHGSGISYPFDSAANEVVADGLLDLNSYRIVDWILGEESSVDETLSAAERARLVDYLDGGGALLISGADLGWDLDDQGRDPVFYNTYMAADYAGDDAGTYAVVPAAGGPFGGLGMFRFDAPGEYDVDYPDQLLPYGGSDVALSYSGGAGGVAAVYGAQGCRRVVNAGFPFETIRPEVRDRVMARAMAFLGVCLDGPHTVIATPAPGSGHREVPALGGLAWAAGEVERVEVSLFRIGDGPQVSNSGPYWSGSAWVDVPWHLAVGTATWSFPMPPTMEVGRYAAQARLWDMDGLSDTLPAAIQFAIVGPRAFVPLVVADSSGSPMVGTALVADRGPRELR